MTAPTRENSERALARLADINCLMVDMDGVLFRGQKRLPGADRLLGWLRSHDIRYRMLTNNATATPEQNAHKLTKLGIVADASDIFTSSQATATYLVEQGAGGETAFVIGEQGLRAALAKAGIESTCLADEARWVVTGLDRGVTYDALRDACFAIERGAKFVATNADTSLPVERGVAPGAGAIVAAITATTGVAPVVIGKPESAMLTQTMARFNVPVSACAMLGDRLDTDIEAAARLDMLSVLVLTGVSKISDIDRSSVQPDLIFCGLPDVMRGWGAAREAVHAV